MAPRVWNTGEDIDAASLNALEIRAATPDPLVEDEVTDAEEYYLTSPFSDPARSGTFTPLSDKVRIGVEIGAQVTGLAKMTAALLIGPPGSTTVNYGLPQLVRDKEYNNGGDLAEDVREFPLGSLNPHSFPWDSDDPILATPGDRFRREVIVDGLTPGQEYKWEIALGIVGGMGVLNLGVGDGAGRFAVSKETSMAGFTTALVHAPFSSKAHIVLLGKTPNNYAEHLIESVNVAAGTECCVAVTDDGSLGIITNATVPASGLQVVDLHSGIVTAYAIKAGASNAWAVDIDADGEIAYVCAYGSAKVLRFNLGTRTWETTEYTVGAVPYDVRISPDGTKLAVACYGPTATRLAIVNLSNGAVTQHALPGGYAGTITGCDWHPEGEIVWVTAAEAAQTHLLPFDVGSSAWVTARAATITGIAGFPSFQPDGKNLFVFTLAEPLQVRQYRILDGQPPREWLQWGTGGVLGFGACGPHGEIMTTSFGDTGTPDLFMRWWGARARIRDYGLGEHLKVTVEGVDEGA